MNPLNSNPFGNVQQNNFQTFQLNNRFISAIKEVKSLMQASRGDPNALVQQYPQMRSILQMAQGKDLKSLFYTKCQDMGVDPNVILNELRS